MPDETFAVPDSPSNQGVIARLEALGKRVIRLPSPAVCVRELTREEAAAISRPEEFDWILFEDIRAASDLEQIAAAAGLDLFDLDSVKVCACGEPIADRLRFCQIHADLIPAGPDPETVAVEMTAYEGGNLNGLKVLSLSGSAYGGGPASGLAEAGANVTRIVVHETTGETRPIDGRTKSMLIAGGVDAVYFGASVDVADVGAIFSKAGIAFLPESVRALCGDRETKTTLAERGVRAEIFPVY